MSEHISVSQTLDSSGRVGRERRIKFSGELTDISHSWEMCEKHSTCATCYWQASEKNVRSGSLRASSQAAYLDTEKKKKI